MTDFKERFSNHIRYYWYVYLIYAGVAAALLCTVYSRLAQPKANQRISVFSTVSPLNEEAFSQALIDASGGELREASSSVAYQADYSFSMVLITRMMTCDLLILPQSAIPQEWREGCALPIDKESMEADLGVVPVYWEKDGQAYGLMVYDPDNPQANGFTRLYGEGFYEAYWLFFGSSTVNAGKEGRGALAAAAYLIR